MPGHAKGQCWDVSGSALACFQGRCRDASGDGAEMLSGTVPAALGEQIVMPRGVDPGVPRRTGVSLAVPAPGRRRRPLGRGPLAGRPSPPHYRRPGESGAHVFSSRATRGILTSHFHLFNLEFAEIIYQPRLPPGPGEAGQSSAAGARREARDARAPKEGGSGFNR